MNYNIIMTNHNQIHAHLATLDIQILRHPELLTAFGGCFRISIKQIL